MIYSHLSLLKCFIYTVPNDKENNKYVFVESSTIFIPWAYYIYITKTFAQHCKIFQIHLTQLLK